ncbi:glycosyltransferase family 9 protein [Gilliamella sp. B2776]|uniref:glycosyltransferase family 9 protein n=1 Tax=unclassified Gilliamella TaxID=2685620 RepID=UPI00226AB479|nr:MULTISPECIES: glycosyltransferase family 9 protein [unclassified Gilliamella]MCX8649099.1 glycosyltransferase family 9 protein [Gilliamella sp. B2779]MCX8653025.1 glycosyltransferase family 9 protein [Gilliamella sp. B2737]MCX8690911.1 glycosyltransferase family 9 protein [Gilliamella sp. B2776]MCX8702069.1 glycosyltransferase family 9 protein [Gilliamella sp. B2781]WDM18120.1 glycosyltransferase family 9 protein [Gilliamella sp. B3022]
MINKLMGCIKYLNRQRNLKIKPLKSAIKLYLLNRKKKERSLLTLEHYSSVAILMNDQGIGDAIVTSYLIESLRKNSFKVYVVVEKRIAFLFDEFITVDGILFYDRNKNITKIKEQLDNIKIDVVVDLVDKGPNSVRRSQIIKLINPLHTIGFNQEKYKLYDSSIDYHEYTSHITMRSQKVLELINIKTESIKYHLNIPANIEQEVKDYLNPLFTLGKKIIIFNPFGSNTARSFSNSQIEIILSFLAQLENYITIVVGESDKISRIKVPQNIIINQMSCFFNTVALVKYSDFVITVDTSIVHVASTYDKKMICIYNNRIIDSKFINNMVWGPNYANAIQIFTNENVKTGLGDLISNLDVNIILKQLNKELNK